MSDDEQALLRSVAAAPDDDTPRLIYADWLQEHGSPLRAEFIRLQIEIVGKADLPQRVRDRHVGLWKRQQELFDGHFDDLLGPLAGMAGRDDVEFDRGFVSLVTLGVDDFLARAPRLADVLPLPGVAVERVAARLADFLRCPHLDVVTCVSAYSDELSELGIDGATQDDVLDSRGRLTRLEVLDLEGCHIGDFGVRLLTLAHLPALVELDLSGNNVTDFGVAELLDWPAVRLLRRLVLGGNPIGDQGAFEIADRLGPHNRIENLNLRFTDISHAGQNALLPRFGGRLDLF